jgi:hypothetical protein
MSLLCVTEWNPSGRRTPDESKDSFPAFMNKTRLFISLILAVAAVVAALRYRTLQQLKSDQVQFRQQIDEAAELRAAIAKKQAVPTTPSDAALSNPEHLELLRLRNEIGQLRRDLAAESNQVAILAAKPVKALRASAEIPTEGVVTKEQMVAKLNRGREEALGLIRLATDHDQWPVALGSADEFELLVTGKMSDIKFPSRVIALREKQPWKDADGKWGRTYVFADGHTVIRRSDTEDFTELERQMTQANPVSAR